MAKSLYLINPRSKIPTYFGGEMYEHWGLPSAQGIADLATVTVAALAPTDWSVTVCEEFVEPVDFDSQADYIGLTGKITQAPRMLEIADEFRRRGKVVLIGGPHASLSPNSMRGHCDVLVIGELEDIAEKFFADLDSGDFQAEYVADKPDLAETVIPRWDLYPNARAVDACVQTSRGCPFECEFCDVIMYLGRKQRHKSNACVLEELDQVYALGYRSVFLADDNLTVYRKRAKSLLKAIRNWNLAKGEHAVAFTTQVSIDASRDPEIMSLMAEAGMVSVFIGIETPNPESLKESKKRQNVGIDLLREVQVFLDHGIVVVGGMIVGFDNDDHRIFRTQFDFAMASPIPIFTLGALMAAAATPLHDRMEAAGRLTTQGDEMKATPWDTNIMPLQMTQPHLIEGLQWLGNQVYSPANFGRRLIQMIEALGPRRGALAVPQKRAPRPVNEEALVLLKKLIRSGKAERKMWMDVSEAIAAKPEAGDAAIAMMFRYAQVRCLYDSGNVWEEHPAPEPPVLAV